MLEEIERFLKTAEDLLPGLDVQNLPARLRAKFDQLLQENDDAEFLIFHANMEAVADAVSFLREF